MNAYVITQSIHTRILLIVYIAPEFQMGSGAELVCICSYGRVSVMGSLDTGLFDSTSAKIKFKHGARISSCAVVVWSMKSNPY